MTFNNNYSYNNSNNNINFNSNNNHYHIHHQHVIELNEVSSTSSTSIYSISSTQPIFQPPPSLQQQQPQQHINSNLNNRIQGYNYDIKDKIIIENNDGDGFNTAIPFQLVPFFINPQEYKNIIISLNNFSPRSRTSFNIIIALHIILMFPFVFILAFFSNKKHSTSNIPMIVGIIILSSLFISAVFLGIIKNRYIKKEILDFYKGLSQKFEKRGLNFSCTLSIKHENDKCGRHVTQTKLIIEYPHKEDSQQSTQPIQNLNNNNNNINNNNNNINNNNNNFIYYSQHHLKTFNNNNYNNINNNVIVTLEKVDEH